MAEGSEGAAQRPHLLIEDMSVGRTFSFTRRVTEEDLQATMRLTGDLGGYHTDEEFARSAGFRGIIAPGLLQAGMMTQIGGSFNFLAREMQFRFLKPVYAGDLLTITATVMAVQPERNFMQVHGDVVNQDGVVVLTVDVSGHLPRREWGVPKRPPPPIWPQ